MQLSIIIVNYNVRFFLEQCLFSVRKAISGIAAEVIVADNGSTDGSIDYLAPMFPEVQFIRNEQNLGFAKANNRALSQCSGEYILFLNPDTLIPEDSLLHCLSYMAAHTRAGALGVRMIDGSGRFLPESKRSFPSPMASFYKLVGLAHLFPRSGVFNKYALGNLDEYQNQEVPVLAGACLLVRKAILDRLAGFDERYFMYGEDIDLSYRIRQAGFQNHYFAGTTILHFKGKSSRRGSLAHVRIFYGAMQVFVDKYYAKGYGRIFAFFIQVAIGFRAILSLAGRIARPTFWQKNGLVPSWQTMVVTTDKEYEQLLLIAGTSPKEITFCEGSLSLSGILTKVQLLADRKTRFLFRMNGSQSVVGSDIRSF